MILSERSTSVKASVLKKDPISTRDHEERDRKLEESRKPRQINREQASRKNEKADLR
jgi:hypothetical protein